MAQDPKVLVGRWDTWLYMPWRYQWTIGTGDEGGRFCREYGINGGFTDHGEGPWEWLEQWQLRFYNDHTADKGYLYLHGANQRNNFTKYQRDARAVRSGSDGPQPIDAAMLERLRKIVGKRVSQLKASPMRVAYALDDEISWGSFVMPMAWRLNERRRGLRPVARTVLRGRGAQGAVRDARFPLGSVRPARWASSTSRRFWTASPTTTPFGRTSSARWSSAPTRPTRKRRADSSAAQAPSIWGGYDYAKLTKKIQFIEAYDLGSSQAIIRSFNPGNAMPVVTTHFHRPSAARPTTSGRAGTTSPTATAA